MREREAIKRELATLSPRLRRFCRALAQSPVDGDDLAQSALLKALARLDQFRRDDRLDAWLFKIAHRTWLDQKRAESRRPTAPPDALEALGDGGLGARRAEDRLDLARLRAAMAGLPEEQRAALALVAIEGLSYQEAADALETPIGTVMSRVARARKKLLKTTRAPNEETAP